MGRASPRCSETALDLLRARPSRLCSAELPSQALAPLKLILDRPEAAFQVPCSVLLDPGGAGRYAWFAAEMTRLGFRSWFRRSRRPVPKRRAVCCGPGRKVFCRPSLSCGGTPRAGHPARPCVEKAGWKRGLDRLFLHPRWGLGRVRWHLRAGATVVQSARPSIRSPPAPLAAWNRPVTAGLDRRRGRAHRWPTGWSG